jgi:uncharacterized short protein YbdD (DUF466 family)
MRCAPNNPLRNFRHVWRRFWSGLREWCGDAAYERYLRSVRQKSVSCDRLTREEFYVEQLNRRYSRPNRCC